MVGRPDAGALDTAPKLLARNARERGERPAMRHKDHGIWQAWTWAEANETVRALAAGLMRLGLARGDTVAIVGRNRPLLYWTMAAAQALGAVPVPVYADAVADEMAYVLDHADARFAVVQDQEQVDKLLAVSDRLPRLAHILYDEDRGLRLYDESRLAALRAVIAAGRAALADPTTVAALDRDIAAGHGSDTSVMLYTSGTTGRPKGVILTHDNVLISAANGCAFDTARRDDGDDRVAAARLGRRPHLRLRAIDGRGLPRFLPRKPRDRDRRPARDRDHLPLRAAARLRGPPDADDDPHGGRAPLAAGDVPLGLARRAGVTASASSMGSGSAWETGCSTAWANSSSTAP